MRKFIRPVSVLPAILICALAQVAQASPAGIWSEIPFVRGADLNDLESTIVQSRDSVRKELMNEFGSLLIPLVESGADAGEVSQDLAQILLRFDGVYEAHKADAEQNLGVSLDSIFRADFDALYTSMGVSDPERQAEFVIGSAASAQAVAGQIDFIMFGSYTIASPIGGAARVILTVTLDKYITGETRSFRAEGTVSGAIASLAQQVFDFFQSNQYPAWVNPAPQLSWIVPPASAQPATAVAAISYCRGQGARLPYASELIQASQGTRYQPGGIPSLEVAGIYPVADRDQFNEQYYYFVGQDSSTGGPVRTDAGYGTISGDFYCVKGNPSAQVNFTQSLYRLWRNDSDTQVRNAIDYLLVQVSDLGMAWQADQVSGLFPSSDAALSLLRSKGIELKIPAGLLGQN